MYGTSLVAIPRVASILKEAFDNASASGLYKNENTASL